MWRQALVVKARAIDRSLMGYSFALKRLAQKGVTRSTPAEQIFLRAPGHGGRSPKFCQALGSAIPGPRFCMRWLSKRFVFQRNTPLNICGVKRIAILRPSVVSPAPQISAQMLGCTHHFGGGVLNGFWSCLGGGGSFNGC